MAKRRKKSSARRRTPAQIAATKRMLAAAKRARRKVGVTVARTTRRKRRTARKEATPVASTRRRTRRKSTRRKSSRRSFAGGRRRGFVPAGTPMAVASTVGGFAGVTLALNNLPLPAAVQTGWGRVAAKAGVAVALGMILRRIGGKNIANGVMVGGLAAASLDAINRVRPGLVPGMEGYPEAVYQNQLEAYPYATATALPPGLGQGTPIDVDADGQLLYA